MLVQNFVLELALANNDESSFHICHIDYGLRTGNTIKCVKSRLCRVFLDLATARNGRQMAQRNTKSSAAASAWFMEKCTVTQCGRGCSTGDCAFLSAAGLYGTRLLQALTRQAKQETMFSASKFRVFFVACGCCSISVH